MAAGLNKFPGMQASAFFRRMIVAGQDLNFIDERGFDPFGVAIPLNVGEAVLQVDWTWEVVESRTAPIPELESKDVRRGADFETTLFAPEQ